MQSEAFGFKNGSLTLDERNCVYYSGQRITGKIKFELDKPITLTNINVINVGDANVQWSDENSSNLMKSRNKQFQYHEEYFHHSQCVFGEDGISHLQSGVHTIPFSYQLPFTVPSSFESEFGKVTYCVYAYLNHESGMKEELFRDYRVIAPLDLKNKRDALLPMEFEIGSLNQQSWLCISDQFVVFIRIPSLTYIPGQVIPIDFGSQDETSVVIHRLTFMIIVKERFHSQLSDFKYEPTPEIFASNKIGPVSFSPGEVHHTELQVPRMIPPNLTYCNIIDVTFFLRVKIQLKKWSRPLEDERELNIGFFPISGVNFETPTVVDGLPRGKIPDPLDSKQMIASMPPILKLCKDFHTSFHLPNLTGTSYLASSPGFASIADVVDKNYNVNVDLY